MRSCVAHTWIFQLIKPRVCLVHWKNKARRQTGRSRSITTTAALTALNCTKSAERRLARAVDLDFHLPKVLRPTPGRRGCFHSWQCYSHLSNTPWDWHIMNKIPYTLGWLALGVGSKQTSPRSCLVDLCLGRRRMANGPVISRDGLGIWY